MNDETFLPSNPLNTDTGIKATKKELQFIKKYKELNGNQTGAAKLVYNCKNDKSASAFGSKLARKFGLVKPTATVMPDNQYDSSGFDEKKMKSIGIENGPGVVPSEDDVVIGGGLHGRIEVLSDALKSGMLSFKEMFNEMRKIAFCYRDKGVSIRALIQLKEWWDEAKKQRDNMEMAERDVIDVLSTALATVDRKAYIEILKLCRRQRSDLIHERNREIDVEAIVKEEQEKRLFSEEEST